MNKTLTILAAGLSAGILYSGSQAVGAGTPADPRDTNDIPAAAERSASHGWPHRPTRKEARQVARFTNREVGAMAARSVTRCRPVSPNSAGWWNCKTVLVFTHNELTGARLPKPEVYRFRTWTRVWEDGSARVFYPGV